MLSILAEWRLDDIILTSVLIRICHGNRFMTSLVLGHGKQCSINFSLPLQTEILSTETSDFLN